MLVNRHIYFVHVCHSVSFYAGFFRWVYERFRLPIAPVYGGFPVKFRTYLGDPIPYDPNINAAELAETVRQFFPPYQVTINCDPNDPYTK